MINELYQLNRALTTAEIDTKDFQFDPSYREVATNPRCFKVTVNDGEVIEFSELDETVKKQLRTYGNNQGTYPCMNLTPLASVEKDDDKKFINEINNHPELLNEEKLRKLEEIFEAGENRWKEKKFKKHYKNHFVRSKELLERCGEYDRLVQLVTDTKPYEENIERLREQLKAKAMESLKNVTNVDSALGILFSFKAGTKDNIVVAFESETCERECAPVVCADFIREVNKRLLKNRAKPGNKEGCEEVCDAFGQTMTPLKKDTMPKINLPGISGVILRTMNKDQECQKRYRRTGGETYPLNKDTQKILAAALGWISAQHNEGTYWMKIQDGMLMFCYPDHLPDIDERNWDTEVDKETLFKTRAKNFLQQFTKLREEDDPHRSKAIRIFIIRKLDEGRNKVIYTRQTDPVELEALIEEWTAGCHNLPAMPQGIQYAITHRIVTEEGKKESVEVDGLDPFEAVDLMNKAFQHDGSVIERKGKKAGVSKHHGIELLMESKMSVDADLAQLVCQEMKVITTFGRAKFALSHSKTDPTWTAEKKRAAEKASYETADMLALSALLLYRKNIKKETYMESLPYLFGQLLKASDELHCLYCDVVRDSKLPPELAGGAMVSAAVDAPARALALLGKRIMPYYNWAKSYAKKQEDAGNESPAEKEKADKYKRRARWIEKIYRELANQLKAVQMTTGRFSDVEKAQLFIGYFAELDNKKDANCETENNQTNEEEQNNE